MLESQLKTVREYIENCKAKIASSVKQASFENTEITVKSNSPRIFTINSSAFSSKSFDPFYYDYMQQFDYVIEQLEKRSLDSFSNMLHKIVQTGTADGYRFHPDVIERLRTII